LIID